MKKKMGDTKERKRQEGNREDKRSTRREQNRKCEGKKREVMHEVNEEGQEEEGTYKTDVESIRKNKRQEGKRWQGGNTS